ncbi:MAG TPA: TonB-dependent receptor [Candidatus Baltobacteraceae bacterium]|nr:TonB-dependent receptor [Candidatus Baltobacteraceae bacterium]
MAPAFAQTTPPAPAAPASATTSQVSGVVTDPSGSPVAGATITLTGPHTYTATSDAQGQYLISSVAAGVYQVAVQRPGYQTGTEQDFAVVAGQPATLNVQLAIPTLTSLRQIGSTRTTFSRAQFNTSPASVNVVTTQAFIDQGQPQVRNVLNEQPGLVISLPATSGNGAAPGAITFPNIRGGLSFETASLIDGHPVSVGAYGDYVTTFLSPYVLGSIEVVKGPGAEAPEVNYAIGGTVNFRTLDPTKTPSGFETTGFDSFGGQFSNFGYSNTFGKLGVVVDYAVDGTQGPLYNSTWYSPVSSSWTINGQVIAANPVNSPIIAGTPTRYNAQSETALYGGLPISSTFDNHSELVKFRYDISPVTSVTASYLGSQTWTEQNGNHLYLDPSTFLPGAAYGYPNIGPQPGSVNLVEQNVYAPAHEWEVNNEPIFQAEARTQIGNNNLLVRGYSASISRLQYNGQNVPSAVATLQAPIYGTLSLCPPGYAYSSATVCKGPGGVTTAPTPTTFTGQTATIAEPGSYFNSSEEDRLYGYSAEFDHPFGAPDSGDMLSAEYNTTKSETGSYQIGTYKVGCSSCYITVPPTSTQLFNTLLLRAIASVGPRMGVQFSNYFNTYDTHYSTNFGSTFQNQQISHFDSRLGLTYRANPNVSIRASAGSAIAPPYLALYSQGTTTPVIDRNTNAFATNTEANPNIKPETSFGYDLGADARVSADGATVATMDLYDTNLWNQLISTSQYLNGSVTLPTYLPGDTTGHPTGPATTVPLYSSGATNLARARYEGIELGIKRVVPSGFGFVLQGSLMHATPVNIPSSFYTVPGSTVISRNEGIIVGPNFYGGYQGVSNQPIPYSQGYGEISWRTASGALLAFNTTYYGPNNSFFLPAFTIAGINARAPVGHHGFYLNVDVDNLFNTYGNAYITEYAGFHQPLVPGATYSGNPVSDAVLNANAYGPRDIRISLSYLFGSRAPYAAQR